MKKKSKIPYFYKYAMDEKSSESHVIDSRQRALTLMAEKKKTHFTASVISVHSAAI